jgi:hypothetical protein
LKKNEGCNMKIEFKRYEDNIFVKQLETILKALMVDISSQWDENCE